MAAAMATNPTWRVVAIAILGGPDPSVGLATVTLFHVKANLGYAWPVSGRGRAGGVRRS
jgi:hypothetical protein